MVANLCFPKIFTNCIPFTLGSNRSQFLMCRSEGSKWSMASHYPYLLSGRQIEERKRGKAALAWGGEKGCGCVDVCSQKGMKSEWKRWWRGFHMIGEPDSERIGCLGHGWSTGSQGRGRDFPDSKAGKPWRGTFLGCSERLLDFFFFFFFTMTLHNKYSNSECEAICIKKRGLTFFSFVFLFQLLHKFLLKFSIPR